MKEYLIGVPVYFEGKYQNDIIYDLYVQNISCSFEIKKDKIPCIQIKNKTSFYASNEYITTTYNEKTGCHNIEDLTLTSVDLKLFFEQYKVWNIEWRWWFQI